MARQKLSSWEIKDLGEIYHFWLPLTSKMKLWVARPTVCRDKKSRTSIGSLRNVYTTAPLDMQIVLQTPLQKGGRKRVHM